ncbi:MAG: cupredoxin domain-containing protein [Actinomycetota bacterium]
MASTGRKFPLIVLPALFVILVSCGSPSAEEPSPDAPEAEVPTVTMRLIQFRPATVEVLMGTEVTWIQEDAGDHTVTSGTVVQEAAGVAAQPDGEFDSGRIATGDKFTQSFDQPGTYSYYCEIHPATMRGEVRVQG